MISMPPWTWLMAIKVCRHRWVMPDRTRVPPTKLAQRVRLLQSSVARSAVTAFRSDGREN